MIYQYIAEELGLLETKDPPVLSDFNMVATIEKLKALDCHYIPQIEEADCYLFLMNYKIDRTRTSNPYDVYGTNPKLSDDRDYFYYLWMPLVQDWGSVLIQPERFSDKVIQFFKKDYDINFKSNKKFSAKYLVQSPDRFRVEYLVTEPFMKVLENQREIVLEFSGKGLLLRSLLPASIEIARNLINIAALLAPIISVIPEDV